MAVKGMRATCLVHLYNSCVHTSNALHRSACRLGGVKRGCYVSQTTPFLAAQPQRPPLQRPRPHAPACLPACLASPRPSVVGHPIRPLFRPRAVQYQIATPRVRRCHVPQLNSHQTTNRTSSRPSHGRCFQITTCVAHDSCHTMPGKLLGAGLSPAALGAPAAPHLRHTQQHTLRHEPHRNRAPVLAPAGSRDCNRPTCTREKQQRPYYTTHLRNRDTYSPHRKTWSVRSRDTKAFCPYAYGVASRSRHGSRRHPTQCFHDGWPPNSAMCDSTPRSLQPVTCRPRTGIAQHAPAQQPTLPDMRAPLHPAPERTTPPSNIPGRGRPLAPTTRPPWSC